MIDVFVKRPVLTNLLFIILLTMGYFSFRRLPMEAFPEMNFGTVIVSTVWPGATAEDVERQISIPMEEKLADVNNILELDCISTPSLSQIRMKFDENLKNEDYEELYKEVQNKIQEVENVPDNARKPRAILVETQDWRPAYSIVISGAGDERILKQYALLLKDRLKQVPGVAQIDEGGIRDAEIEVQIDSEKLRHYGLSYFQVYEAVSNHSKNIMAGTLRGDRSGFQVRTRGEFRDLQELRNMTIQGSVSGKIVRLKDLASVNSVFEQATNYRKQKGQLAVVLNVKKKSLVNTLELVPRVKEVCEKFRETLPPEIELSYFNDSSLDITRRLGVLKNNLSFGIVLVFMILWLFVGLKNSFLAIIGIPFSFLTGFAFLEWYGITINEISIFSLVIVSGMVVDDAIVILENIVRHFEKHGDLAKASIDGAKEVLYPVVSSTLTTICAFLPMVIMTGEMGRVMIIIPITVTFILIASFIEAFLMLPCHFMELTKLEQKLKGKSQPGSRILNAWKSAEAVLDRFLRKFLCQPKLAFLVLSFFMAGTASIPYLFLGRSVKQDLFPSDVSKIWVNVESSNKATLEQSFDFLSPLERDLESICQDQFTNITALVGGGMDANYRFQRGLNLAQITIDLKESHERTRDAQELVDELRDKLQSSRYPGLDKIVVRKVKTGPPLGTPVSKRLTGRNRDKVALASQEIYDYMREVDGLVDVTLSLKEGQPGLDVVLKEEEAGMYGMSTSWIGTQVAIAVDGFLAGFVHWEDEEVEVHVKAKDGEIRTREDLENLLIQTPTGKSLPLSQVAGLKHRKTYTRLERTNQIVSVLVEANLKQGITATEANQKIEDQIQKIMENHPEVSIEEGSGEMAQTSKSLQSLREAFMIAAFLMYTILATLFNSFFQPLLIMVSIPYAFLGVLLGMGIYDLPFTMLAYIAMVGLAGVVVNDTIVLIDFINNRRDRLGLFEAVLDSTKDRLRAITLTTATTVLGLLPVVLGFGGKSIIWQPMAVTVCFGILAATMITLFLVPCLFLIFHQEKTIQEQK